MGDPFIADQILDFGIRHQDHLKLFTLLGRSFRDAFHPFGQKGMAAVV